MNKILIYRIFSQFSDDSNILFPFFSVLFLMLKLSDDFFIIIIYLIPSILKTLF